MRIERRGPGLLIRYSEEEKKANPQYRIKVLEAVVNELVKRVQYLEEQIKLLRRDGGK